MAEPQVTPPGKWFAWAAVLAGLIPTLWMGGLGLYTLMTILGLVTAYDFSAHGGIVALTLAIVAVMVVTLICYWRVVWLCLEGRPVGTPLWYGSVLLILAWFGWHVWSWVQAGVPVTFLRAFLKLVWLTPFALWAYALKRTY